ncbi:hypothetical protein [Aliarcobacter cryaerophilus]|uniref:hypothetical protein n=1 Tax=Aliarcobacter cryaerophilus TaxID=28198 RepID=UPI0021B696AD|nr:hypothetical protein [Aliarcobacter cryaerophilus]MCT7492002.1 hypothetical protein [Aliarcobacter cryaerophilus]
MIIEIRDDLFYKLVDLMKNRNTTIWSELKEIKPLDVATDTTLQKAREHKTQRVKETIKETIKELLNQDISPTKYQIHKRTKIAYVTINKYYDDILEEVTNGTK